MSSLAKLAPWRAQPLAASAKHAKFRQVMDLRAESVLLGHSAIIAGWIVGGVGVAAMAASIAGWLIILPLKTIEFRVIEVDHSTGIVTTPVSLADAPTTFPEATDHYYLKAYISACEQWVPMMDTQNYRKCQLMSAPDQQARYDDWRHKPSSPPKAVGQGGYVQVDNFRYHRQAVDKNTLIRRYLVQFDRSIWHGSTKDSSRTWSATVDFQYHPELPMMARDRDDNLAGLQVLSYSASSDSPEPSTMEAPK